MQLLVTHILHFLPWRHLRGTNFYGFHFSKRFGKKYKRTRLSLNFVQKQSFSYGNTFSFPFIRTATPWHSKKRLFLKFSFFEGTLRPFKALFVLKTFEFLSWLAGQVDKRLDYKTKVKIQNIWRHKLENK